MKPNNLKAIFDTSYLSTMTFLLFKKQLHCLSPLTPIAFILFFSSLISSQSLGIYFENGIFTEGLNPVTQSGKTAP